MLPAGFYISCHPIHSLPVFIRCPRPSFSYPVFAPPSSRFPSWGVVVNCLSLLSAYRLSVPFVVSSGVPLCGAGRFCFPSRFVSGRLACRRSCSSFRRVGSFWRRAVFVSSFSRVVVLISFVPFVVSSARVVLRFVRSRRLACRPVVRFGFLRLVGRLVMRLVRRLVFSSYSLRRPSSFIGRGCPRDWRLVLRRLVRRLSFSFAPVVSLWVLFVRRLVPSCRGALSLFLSIRAVFVSSIPRCFLTAIVEGEVRFFIWDTRAWEGGGTQTTARMRRHGSWRDGIGRRR